MAYLGQTAHETEFTNRVTDTMTGDGSDTTLTLSTAPISVNNVIVFIDGVMQRPTTDFTVSGTTLTFAVAPHNSANVQAITGGGEHIGIPAAPITEDQLVDGVITASKLESGIQIPASKITSLAASKLTGALPALDGSALTNMPPLGVGIDNVTVNPSPTTNPSGGVGTIHLNKTTGEMFVCTNAATNNNIWFNVGEGSGDITNTSPTNPTSTNSFPDITESSSATFQFSGATDPDAGDTVTHYMVDQISNGALSVSVAEVAAGSSHTFNTSAVGSDTAVTFRVRAKDNHGKYSSGVTVSMTVTNISHIQVTSNVTPAVSGDYHVYTFGTSGGNFNVTSVPASGPNTGVRYLVVGGGGSGANHIGGGAAGGGAGGMRFNNAYDHTVSVQNYSITVGAGGNSGTSVAETGYKGGNSSFSTITATGGGGGGRPTYIGGTITAQSNGGSGGGGGWTGGTGGVGNQGGYSPSEGNNGKTGAPGGSHGSSGSQGGGAGHGGEAPWAGTSAAAGGAGGAGTSNDITGASLFYAGGGGGGCNSPSGVGGAGGSGVGGQGHVPATNTAAESGMNGRGGGGGGNGYPDQGFHGGDGGDGVVIIRVKFQN